MPPAKVAKAKIVKITETVKTETIKIPEPEDVSATEAALAAILRPGPRAKTAVCEAVTFPAPPVPLLSLGDTHKLITRSPEEPGKCQGRTGYEQSRKYPFLNLTKHFDHPLSTKPVYPKDQKLISEKATETFRTSGQNMCNQMMRTKRIIELSCDALVGSIQLQSDELRLLRVIIIFYQMKDYWPR